MPRSFAIRGIRPPHNIVHVKLIHSRRGEQQMAKVINCRDVGADCDFEARAETEEELFVILREHARTGHGMEDIPPELVEQVRSAIREE
jgi:predicted small metal-binding protein